MFVPAAALSPRPRKLAVIVALLLVLCYLGSFHDYGFQLEDEGTILYQIHRTVSGQLPYREFATGYTPGFFWINALVFRLFGESVGVLRIFLLFIHGLTALGLVLVSGWILSPGMALWPVLLWFVFLPLFPGEFCSFNVPYPAWYATAGFVWSAVGAMRWREQRRVGWLVVASLAAAFALACKPNSGAFAFVAIGITILRANQTTKDPFWWFVWGGISTIVAAAFGFRFLSVDFAVYWLPVIVVMIILAAGRLRSSRGGSSAEDAARAWVSALIPAAVTTAPWLLFLLGTLGIERFIREVMLLGSGAEAVYYLPFPLPGRVSGAAALVLASVGILGIMLGRTRSVGSAAVALVTAGVTALGAFVAVASGALIPEGFVQSVAWQLENAAFPLCLAVQWFALFLLARRLAGPPKMEREEGLLFSRLETGLVFSLCMFLQLYPRADFMHLVTAMPLTLVLGFFLLERSIEGWVSACSRLGGRRLAGAVRFGAAAVIASVILIRLVPNIEALTEEPTFTLASDRAKLSVPSDSADLLAELDELVREIERLTPAGESVFTFPALAAVNFLAAREAPTRHDYFFPGRPDHADEARVVETLLANPPALAVALNRDFRFFTGSPSYYFLLRRFFLERYRLVGRVGRFDILAYSRSRKKQHLAASERDRAVASRQKGRNELNMDDLALTRLVVRTRSRSTRRRAVGELLARVNRRPLGRGLEQWVKAASLSRAEEVLFLRAIRDYGDDRAAAYLVRALSRSDERIRAEALEAAAWIGRRMTAQGFSWERAPVAEGGGELDREATARLLAELLLRRDAAPAARAFAAKVLGLVGSGRARAALAETVAGEANRAVRVAAAEGLLRLGGPPFDCSLVSLLGGIGLEVRDVLPSVVLESYLRHPKQMRLCITAAIRRGLADGAPQRALARAREAVWIVAAASDQKLVPLLKRAAAGPPSLAFAAKWSLAYLKRQGVQEAANSHDG